MSKEDLVEYCAPSMEHPVAIVLGSGLGALADRVKVVRRIPYEDIDGFPQEALPIEGHRFEVLVGTIDGVPVVVYPGRVHLYQGYNALQVTSLVRHAHRLGCRDIILTCASGAVSDAKPGTFGLITDQMNLTGHNPLSTPEGAAHSLFDTPFVPMTGAYSNYLTTFAREPERKCPLLKRFSSRDVILYLMLLLLMIFAVNTVQQMDEADDPTYSQVRTLFEQEKVKYFVLNGNDLGLQIREEGDKVSTVHYQLPDLSVFYSDLHELIDQQHESGVLEGYDYKVGIEGSYGYYGPI